jgi:MerR family transcriptional regulator, light-induced transcriptional regulator
MDHHRAHLAILSMTTIEITALSASLTISAVERETGLGKDTLRVWERRYGFPAPLRNGAGERRYPDAQVTKLRVIRQLIDRGLRPSKLLHRSLEDLTLELRVPTDGCRIGPPISQDMSEILAAVRSHSPDTLRRRLKLAASQMGLRQFLVDFVAPLNAVVGDEWARGQFTIAQEHFYSEQMQGVLRQAIEAVPGGDIQPRMLLTTLPGEQHQLGLLMAQASLALEGVHCISLGIQTPVADIQHAADAYDVDIVGLSFSPSFRERDASDGLRALRSQLSPKVGIWAGGSLWQNCAAELPGVAIVSELSDIPGAVAQWRVQHPNPAQTRVRCKPMSSAVDRE